MRRTAFVVLSLALLTACGEGGDEEERRPDPCVSIKEEANDAAQASKDAVEKYDTLTNDRVQTMVPGAAEAGEDARIATLTFMHIVANNPDCFSAAQVARAQALIPGLEERGTVPTYTP